jgi:large subunit ribosomal protein L23e
MSSKRGRGGTTGAKFRMTLGLPVAAVINCAGAFGVVLCCVVVAIR